MFADAIKNHVHPATWAVFGFKRDPTGGPNGQLSHRGTAFAMDDQGHLLTCWHVTYMDQDCQVECDELGVAQPELGTVRYPATVVAKERDRDIALLKITGDTKTKPVRLFGPPVPFGRSCCSFGHPLSIADQATQSMRIFTRAAAGTVSMPFVANRFPGTRAIALYELDYFTHGGSSGGPVFLREGDVFAFVSGSRLLDDGTGNQTRSNLTVAIDISEAIKFLEPFNINLKVHGSTKR